MECPESGGDHANGRPYRWLLALTAAAAISISAQPSYGAARAVPKDLVARVEALHKQIATLTERFNGLRVRLKQAQQRENAAKKALQRHERELAGRRDRLAAIAGHSYMASPGDDPGIGYITARNPRQYLEQATALFSLRSQHADEVAAMIRATATAERARTAARKRTAEVTRLIDEIGGKRKQITKLVAKAETKLYRDVLARVEGAGRGSRSKVDVPVIGKGKAATAARWALTQQLKPYIWGAEGPRGFDCSGLVMAAYQQVGIKLPHYTGDQWTAGEHIGKDDLRPGDLVFFYDDLHHVGIYIGGGMMVHAPQTGDVVHVAPISTRPYAGAVRVSS